MSERYEPGELVTHIDTERAGTVWVVPCSSDLRIAGDFCTSDIAVVIEVLVEPGIEYARLLTAAGVCGWVPIFSIRKL